MTYHRIVHVCQSVSYFISEKVLKNLQTHLKENGPVPRVHGNKGHLPPNTFSFETVKFVVSFILNYAELCCLPQPAAGQDRAEILPIYLPAHDGYNLVHKKICSSLHIQKHTSSKISCFCGNMPQNCTSC